MLFRSYTVEVFSLAQQYSGCLDLNRFGGYKYKKTTEPVVFVMSKENVRELGGEVRMGN